LQSPAGLIYKVQFNGLLKGKKSFQLLKQKRLNNKIICANNFILLNKNTIFEIDFKPLT